MSLIFLNRKPVFLQEAEATDTEAGGADMTGNDMTTEDTASETAEDPAEAEEDNPDADNPDMGDDGANIGDMGGDDSSSPDASSESTPDTSTDDPNAPEEKDPEELILIRKKKQLFDYFTDLYYSSKNLVKSLNSSFFRAVSDEKLMGVINTLRKSVETTTNILEEIITKDFNTYSYENLLFEYQQHLSTIKLATKIFAQIQNHES